MAVFKHGNEGTFFQKDKNFFRKAWFLAQFHGDSEGAFSVSSFFQRNSGAFWHFAMSKLKEGQISGRINIRSISIQ